MISYYTFLVNTRSSDSILSSNVMEWASKIFSSSTARWLVSEVNESTRNFTSPMDGCAPNEKTLRINKIACICKIYIFIQAISVRFPCTPNVTRNVPHEDWDLHDRSSHSRGSRAAFHEPSLRRKRDLHNRNCHHHHRHLYSFHFPALS